MVDKVGVPHHGRLNSAVRLRTFLLRFGPPSVTDPLRPTETAVVLGEPHLLLMKMFEKLALPIIKYSSRSCHHFPLGSSVPRLRGRRRST
jgi:hypothetical protein